MLTAYKRYFEFAGRSGPKEYWLFILFLFVVYALLLVIDIVLGTAAPSEDVGWLSGLFLLVSLIPLYAVMVRRLHDAGYSGWWVLTALVPLLNFVIFIVVGLLPKTAGPNRFGARAGTGQSKPPVHDLDRLEQLGRLRDQGLLSEAEFEAQKAVVLRSS